MSLAGAVGPSRRNRESSEARARIFWCGLIVGLLMLQVVTGLAAVTLASADSSFAVVPGFHEQALNWDETQAKVRKSVGLGWQDDVYAAVEADVLGRRRLTVELRDRDGMPVTGANMTAVVFHHARANEAQKIRFVESKDAVYQAKIPMRQNGLWEVRLAVTRRGDHFVIGARLKWGWQKETRDDSVLARNDRRESHRQFALRGDVRTVRLDCDRDRATGTAPRTVSRRPSRVLRRAWCDRWHGRFDD